MRLTSDLQLFGSGVAGALILKIAAALVAFVASIVFARSLGPGGFGAFAVITAWVSILGTISCLGFPQYLLREGTKSKRHASKLLRYARGRILVAGVVPAAILVSIGISQDDGMLRTCYLIASPLPMLTALAGAQQAAIQSQGMIARSVWPNALAGPLLSILLILTLIKATGQVEVIHVVMSYAFSIIFVVLVYRQLVARLLEAEFRLGESKSDDPWISPTLRMVLPFMMLAGVYLLSSRLDLVMLGLLSSPAEAGSYAVSARAAELLIFVGMALVSFIAPKIALLHRAGNTAGMQALLTTLSRALLLITIPPALVMFVFSHALLDMLYGEPYGVASPVLRVLVVVQVVAIFGGPLGTLLNMTGFERIHLMVVASALVANLLLNVLLIPWLGAMGAALATVVSITGSRIVLLFLVRTKLGLRPSAIGV